MKIILLSGGSGKRLWPLSNDARSKQFLRLLPNPEGGKESMIQRVVRQLRRVGNVESIIVTTGVNQKDSVTNQLDSSVSVVTEPMRRRTFPAIVLACSFLKSQGTDSQEPIIVIPCDTYAGDEYFEYIDKINDAINAEFADLILMGVRPTYPSAKYGYILPESNDATTLRHVERFVEKPDVHIAEDLIEEGALWNGGVFGFKLGYIMDIAASMFGDTGYDYIRSHYMEMPESSFDRQIVEKSASMGVFTFEGAWKDLGTWNTLTDELADYVHGNVREEDCSRSYIINELEIPMICIGAEDMVIAASPDGILISERRLSENLKHLTDGVSSRPMYEERRWGEYKVIDSVEYPDGYCALTKQLVLRPGCSISYQRHSCRDEIWTFVDGEGEIVLDGVRNPVKRGDVIRIKKGQMHAVRAITSLTFIEVQQGHNLVEEDIERFEYDW